MHRYILRSLALAGGLLTFSLSAANAQSAQDRAAAAAKSDTAKLAGVRVVADATDGVKLPALQLSTLPVTVSVTAKRVSETVNVMDAEDAVKYLPSVFLRKRNNGDTQAVMATRVWGVSSSARSLIFADGVPLTALIANNNTIGGPRWGLVSPTEIARIDMMYGPFSAAYAGNSMGAVMEITTRQPAKREGSLSIAQAMQSFDLYGTKQFFPTTQFAATFGDRLGKFSYWLSGNYQKSESQPLTYATSVATPSTLTGGYTALSKLGTGQNVLGATGLLGTGMVNGKIKLAYDLTPELRLAYTFGAWSNDAKSGVETYVQKGGAPTFNALAAFASGNYDLVQQHTAHSLSLRTSSKGDWDGELVASRYRMDKDVQRFPVSAASTGLSFATAGRVAVLNGTPSSTSRSMACGAREMTNSTVSCRLSPAPATIVSPMCCSKVSPASSTAAMPPCAQAVEPPVRLPLASTSTLRCSARASAAVSPAAPDPAMMTSWALMGGTRGSLSSCCHAQPRA